MLDSTNVAPDLCCHMASLGHNKLMFCKHFCISLDCVKFNNLSMGSKSIQESPTLSWHFDLDLSIIVASDPMTFWPWPWPWGGCCRDTAAKWGGGGGGGPVGEWAGDGRASRRRTQATTREKNKVRHCKNILYWYIITLKLPIYFKVTSLALEQS